MLTIISLNLEKFKIIEKTVTSIAYVLRPPPPETVGWVSHKRKDVDQLFSSHNFLIIHIQF